MTDDWDTVTLDRSVVRAKSGFAFAKTRLAQQGAPHLRPFNIGLDGELDGTTVYYLPHDHGVDLAPFALEEGDVLFNNTSSVEVVGKAALVRVPQRGGFSNHVTRLRVVDRNVLRPTWLVLCLRSLWASGYFAREANRWIGQAGFAPTRLRDVQIPLPPPEVQDDLVTEYEATTADCLNALELLRSTAQLTVKLFPSLMTRVAEDMPAERRPLVDTLAAPVRNGWSPVCDNSADGTPVLALGAVLGFRYQPKAYKRTSLPVDPEAGYWLEKGDLVISRSNTAELVGHAAIYSGDPSPCIFPDLLMRLRFKPEEADSEFVLLWLQSPEVRAYIATKATGASPTMKKINQAAVKNVPFPRLDVAEQRRIVKSIAPILEEVDLTREMLEDAEGSVAGLDASLLRSLVPVVDEVTVGRT
jgi:Type I restriction modification DNA specificity domain